MNIEQKNLFLFTSGKAVSILGSSIYAFVISLYVLKITGSALNFATTLMLSVIPMILISPVAGVIADRIPKKILVVGMDLICGLLFALLFLYTRTESLSLLVIYLSTVLLNVFTTFFSIAIEAAKPALVSPQKLIQLNAASKLIDSSAAILGPVVGGMVFAFIDLRLLILFNALSFVFSGLTECFIDYHYHQETIVLLEKKVVNSDLYTEAVTVTEPVKSNNAFISELKEGWHYFSKNESLLELFFVFVSLNFLLGFSVNVPAPYIINQLLKLPPSYYGIINSLFPVGLIIGTLTVAQVMKRVSFKKLLITMNAFIALTAAFIGLPLLLEMDAAAHLVYFSGINLMMGIGIAYVDVPITTILQTEIPQQLLGRVMSLIMSFVKVVLPIALIASGLLLKVVPVVLIPVLGASVAFFYSLYLLVKGR